jgi:hypothetical protein
MKRFFLVGLLSVIGCVSIQLFGTYASEDLVRYNRYYTPAQLKTYAGNLEEILYLRKAVAKGDFAETRSMFEQLLRQRDLGDKKFGQKVASMLAEQWIQIEPLDDSSRETLLETAARAPHRTLFTHYLSIVKYLVEQGAAITAVAIQKAKKYGNNTIKTYLEDAKNSF